MSRSPTILVTNDDGIESSGILALARALRDVGDVTVVAPLRPQSGMSKAISLGRNIGIGRRLGEYGEQIIIDGTPVDCVKFALNELLPKLPDIVVSGINGGRNTSCSTFYSGTMGAAIEASNRGIPAIGLSVDSENCEGDISGAVYFSRVIVDKVIACGLPDGVCLNVNIPSGAISQIIGIKVVRSGRGYWEDCFGFEGRDGAKFFYDYGKYHSLEGNVRDTDEYVLNAGYVSVVPTLTDWTCLSSIKIVNRLLSSAME